MKYEITAEAVLAPVPGPGQARREIVLAQKVVTGDLRPINEGRFVEAVLVVEVRDDIIAPLPHLPRSLGKPRLVSIKQRYDPSSGSMQEKTGNED